MISNFGECIFFPFQKTIKQTQIIRPGQISHSDKSFPILSMVGSRCTQNTRKITSSNRISLKVVFHTSTPQPFRIPPPILGTHHFDQRPIDMKT
jgi:hypothetical protein